MFKVKLYLNTAANKKTSPAALKVFTRQPVKVCVVYVLLNPTNKRETGRPLSHFLALIIQTVFTLLKSARCWIE